MAGAIDDLRRKVLLSADEGVGARLGDAHHLDLLARRLQRSFRGCLQNAQGGDT
jgi:hypothetical protein